ncbi:hypothetical protein ABZ912_42500 [Nonomuraea angiospora]|uniref:hypothetical protein n=1 Tax=Nonomuraea angiospora TaxID=46172 RepID=UPI0033C425D3
MSCPVSWCRSAHQGGGAHYAELPPVGPVSLLLLQSATGPGDPGTVRISYPAGGQTRVLEVTPQLCADLADLIAAVPVDLLDAFTAALYQTSTTLGGTA